MSDQQTETRVCRFPGCERSAAPSEAGTGRPPEYCEDPQHHRAAAWRARQRLSAAGDGDVDEMRPVDEARQRASAITGQVAGMIEHLGEQLTSLIGELRTVSDPEAVEAQLESVSTEAAEQVAAANARATRAEQAQRRAEAEREEADAAAEEATGRSEGLAVEIEQLRAEVTTAGETRARLDEELEAARQAQRRAEAESAQLAESLEQAVEDSRRMEGERDEAVAQAKSAEAARAAAEERAGAAEHRVEVEAERVVRAEAGAAEVREQLDTALADAQHVREETSSLREAIATRTAERDSARGEAERERAHGEQRVADLRATYDRQVEQLREELAQARGPATSSPSRSAGAGSKK